MKQPRSRTHAAGPTRAPLSFDIFCRVIDNFGDIGVSWRLARQLAHTPHVRGVRLWVDDLSSAQALLPAIDPDRAQQTFDNVEIIHWDEDVPARVPHDVVVEAFGCELPAWLRTAIAAHRRLWLNLEYLSAEPWVDGFHGHSSLFEHGVRRFFFFPGFTAATGGLLREPDLIARRDAWQSQASNRQQLLRALGVDATHIQALSSGQAQLILLFCYPNAPVATLLQTLAQLPLRSIVLVPEGTVKAPGSHTMIGSTAASSRGSPGGPVKASASANVLLHGIPFVSQADFDPILWSTDLNIVRGEDSMVRALWAGRPMIWQPYIQDDDAHLKKLDAWLQRSPLSCATRSLIRSWSDGRSDLFARLLERHGTPARRDQWQAESQTWSTALARQQDLASALLEFCTKHVRGG